MNQVPQSGKPNRPGRRLLATALAALVALALVVPAATAQLKPSTQSAATPPSDLAVTSYAADYDVEHAEAERRLDRIQPLQEIIASIRGIEAPRLAGWGIDHNGAFTAWVWLTGNQPPRPEAAQLANSHTDVQIRTGATHSLAELLDAQTGLFQDVGPVGQATDNPNTTAQIEPIVTFTDVDMAANAIVIGVDPELATTGAVGMTDEALQSKIAQVAELLQDDLTVRYDVIYGQAAYVDADFKGGEAISGCTSGFSAKHRETGAYGIITAAHCPTPSTMHNTNLTQVAHAHGPDIDAKFVTIPTGASHRILDDYICGPGSPCDVRGTIGRWQMMNNYLCHYGISSGRSCGTVTSINHTPIRSATCEHTCRNTFVQVSGDHLKRCGGDSGGPWYDRGYAFGIHSGGTGGDDCAQAGGKTAHFSAILDVERVLGVDILLTGPFAVN